MPRMAVLARTSWCVVLLYASACSKTAPAVTTIELGGVRAQVPVSWSPSPVEQTRRLEAASRRRDPAAEVQITAVGADNSRAPALALLVIHHSREYTQDATARTMARDGVTLASQAAEIRGIDAKPTYSCATHHCTMTMSIGDADASMHIRSQFWRIEGRVISAGCMGTDLAAVVACDLPQAPPNAEPVPPDEPS